MKTLYLLLLLTGFIPLVLPVPRKYYLIKQGRNWHDAQAYCQATHTDLATIENNDHVVQLQSESQRQRFSSVAWIGLYNDINSWRWSFGNEPLGSVTKWSRGEPNNNGGRQECAAIKSGGWTDKECTNMYSFVCFDDSKTGTERYISVSATKTWRGAQSYCRQYYTDLASTRNDTELSIVRGFFTSEAWIGLFRDSWKWIDKTNFSTISWMNNKPDNKLSNENCGYLNNRQAGDARCSDIMPFFCYSDVTGIKQVVRVKIRSSQDMNDPAVKAAILDEIRKKLKDHGMAENVTVKWRVQPDGLVFHRERNAMNASSQCQN